jgi:hypothetical protein
MEYFVAKGSIVRKIWGSADVVLLIFAGAAAEFALNKAVDWLFFTGKLPADPLGRLFSTVGYAQKIVFAPEQAALQAIDAMSAIHSGVENKRGAHIPLWAYQDVLFMLIAYSIRAYEVLEKPLTGEEKEEVVRVFTRMGSKMGITDLPETYDLWEIQRQEHLQSNLAYSHHSKDLFVQYRKHLGPFRYHLLRDVQGFLVPDQVRKLLGLRRYSFVRLGLPLYRNIKHLRIYQWIKSLILPSQYKEQFGGLEQVALN